MTWVIQKLGYPQRSSAACEKATWAKCQYECKFSPRTVLYGMRNLATLPSSNNVTQSYSGLQFNLQMQPGHFPCSLLCSHLIKSCAKYPWLLSSSIERKHRGFLWLPNAQLPLNLQPVPIKIYYSVLSVCAAMPSNSPQQSHAGSETFSIDSKGRL